MVQQRRSLIIIGLSCLILLGFTVNGYPQQKSDAPQNPAVQQPSPVKKAACESPAPSTGTRNRCRSECEPIHIYGLMSGAFTSEPRSTAIRRRRFTTGLSAVGQHQIEADNCLPSSNRGPKEVTDTWQYDDTARLPTFRGWEAIQIIFPLKVRIQCGLFRRRLHKPGTTCAATAPTEAGSSRGLPRAANKNLRRRVSLSRRQVHRDCLCHGISPRSNPFTGASSSGSLPRAADSICTAGLPYAAGRFTGTASATDLPAQPPLQPEPPVK